MSKNTVLMLFGGESSEHDVSIASARNVYAAIDNTFFDVVLCYIDRNGKWWLIDQLESEISTHGASQLAPVLGSGSFLTLPGNRIIAPDVVLPILHGKNGEDGSVQGLMQLLHIPIVGCDMTASALCMDKLATKRILDSQGIPVVPYEVHYAGRTFPKYDQLQTELSDDLFVKPVRAGSSVGVSKVTSGEQLEDALSEALRHDDVVLIEKAITARELEVAVLGNPPHHKVSGVGEIQPGDEFYSYEAKYSSGSSSKVTIPAAIDAELAERIRSMAGRVYETLGCRGLSRVDFFLADDGVLYVNEINTLPGFTNISMYPKLWRQEGIMYPALIQALISAANERIVKAE